MADFPSLTPDELPYAVGEIPTAEYRGEANVPVLFRVGTVAVGATLELPYTNRHTADIQSIRDHYLAQQLTPFALPAAVWCGNPSASAIAGAGLVWVYTAEPEVEYVSHGFASTTVSLQAVGVNIAATVAGPVLISGTYGGILGQAAPDPPPKPAPIPDPVPTAPVIVTTPPTETQLPPCRVGVGAKAELRIGFAGFFTTGNVEIGTAATVTP